MKTGIQETLTARSPLQQYKEAEQELIEKWEDELAAAIEAEYRRQRADLLGIVHWWLRDIWISTLPANGAAVPDLSKEGLLSFPAIAGTREVALRITSSQALENLETLEALQGWLSTNVQEALALEVGLLKLRL